MYDIPMGRAILPEEEIPRWNLFPEAENIPRQLMNFASKILDDNGFVIIFHAGSLESSQQIVDALDAMAADWQLFLSYDICNDAPTYVPYSKLSHYYSKAEVIVRTSADPTLPKQEYWPFDKNNTGRDTLTLFNFNSKMENDRSGEGKCVGFLQTLMENFTETDDVILDCNAHKGGSLYAAANCGRVIVALTDDMESCEQVIARLNARENKAPPVAKTATTQPESSSRKKPLDDEDELGDPFSDEENRPDTARSTAKKFNWGIQSPVASGLPVYAEQVAKAKADIATPTSMHTSLHQKNIHGRALEFVDDEAAEASSGSPATD
ncbi:hypothetical protein R1sor_025493 [Riccia sorocarpa]|uniref:Uncharacterized protein n=1 Tax=Riccia sorocarpa TaxID=122646 RepID=A0ABD3GBU7_9MARC